MDIGIDTIRALLVAKPRPVGWAERRQRLDEIGSVWPGADDVVLEPAEWSAAPGSGPSRVLLYFLGGGYGAGTIGSYRRLVSEAGRAAGLRTLAVACCLAPEHPFPAALDDAASAWRWLLRRGFAARDIVVGGTAPAAGSPCRSWPACATPAHPCPPAPGRSRPGPT